MGAVKTVERRITTGAPSMTIFVDGKPLTLSHSQWFGRLGIMETPVLKEGELFTVNCIMDAKKRAFVHELAGKPPALAEFFARLDDRIGEIRKPDLFETAVELSRLARMEANARITPAAMEAVMKSDWVLIMHWKIANIPKEEMGRIWP